MSSNVSTYTELPKIRFIRQPETFGCKVVGEVYQQTCPFQLLERDWNDDGDVYSQRIAGFQKVSNVNPFASSYFYLSENDFNDLKFTKSFEFVKREQEHPSLDLRISEANSRSKEKEASNLNFLGRACDVDR